jgi:hypothetical protein
MTGPPRPVRMGLRGYLGKGAARYRATSPRGVCGAGSPGAGISKGRS